MSSIVVTGAGMVGLTTAMLLADDGHDVTVLERDPAAVPATAEAWESWTRRGVAQFRLVHFLHPRFRREAEQALPRVVAAMGDAGAVRLNMLDGIPTEMTGGPRPGDDDFDVITARRPVAESVLAACAEATPRVTIRRGVAIAGLETGAEAVAGVPHVTGVRTEEGDVIAADLVVDATGRRSPLPAWLEAVGGQPPPQEMEDSGFIYYGRHFRSADGSFPPIIGPLLQHYGSISILTLPADNGTWGVAIIASASDTALRAARHIDTWTATVRAMPLAAHWLDGEPIDDRIAVMAKIEDRHRRFVVDGRPVATGVVAVGDSWACTNPSVGRGITIGLLHALALRDLMRTVPTDDPAALARAFDEATTAAVEPWYRATVALDRHRLAEIDAEIAGRPYRPEDPTWDIFQALQFGVGQDPECLRALLSVAGMLRTADEAIAAPGVIDAVLAIGDSWREAPPLGPSREELLAVVSA